MSWKKNSIDDDKVNKALYERFNEDIEAKRSFINRAIDKIAERYKNAKRAISEKIEDTFAGIADIFARDEAFRKVYRKAYLTIRNFHHHNFGRHAAQALANVIATITRFKARLAEISADKYFDSQGIEIKYDKSREAKYKRDENGNIKYTIYKDEYGRKHKSPLIENIKGRYERNTNIELKPGELFREADTTITLFEESDVSTVIHELLGHFQLNNYRELYRTGQLKGAALQDWKTLTKWLGISDLDLKKKLNSEEAKRWQDAHEKFAVGMEKYFREGNIPTRNKKLKRAFETLRRYMYGIYRTMSNIAY